MKRGHTNHGRLRGARWLGEALLPGAALYDLGPFPMAIGGEGQVDGELYAVDWAALPGLDAFEGCPRLYQRRWCSLADGRQAWAYLGQARQVRHSPRLREGRWPAPEPPGNGDPPVPTARRQRGTSAWIWVLPLLGWLSQGIVVHAGGFDTVGACQSWSHSRGAARVELANAIGAAHFLTKRLPFADSDPAHPVELYDPGDIRRVCDR